MAAGLWVLLVIPAIVAFVFCAWVLYSMIIDVSGRDESAFNMIGPDTVRANMDPPS